MVTSRMYSTKRPMSREIRKEETIAAWAAMKLSEHQSNRDQKNALGVISMPTLAASAVIWMSALYVAGTMNDAKARFVHAHAFPAAASSRGDVLAVTG